MPSFGPSSSAERPVGNHLRQHGFSPELLQHVLAKEVAASERQAWLPVSHPVAWQT